VAVNGGTCSCRLLIVNKSTVSILVLLPFSLVETLLWFQITADLVLFIAGNIVGIYHRSMTDRSLSRTFQDVQNFVESRIKLEYERQQQEQLLLSVLPVHLAVEIKNKMMTRLRLNSSVGNVDRKKSPYGRFQEMFIKVHENVR